MISRAALKTLSITTKQTSATRLPMAFSVAGAARAANLIFSRRKAGLSLGERSDAICGLGSTAINMPGARPLCSVGAQGMSWAGGGTPFDGLDRGVSVSNTRRQDETWKQAQPGDLTFVSSRVDELTF